VRYQILIPHIPHRHDKFCQLLETLKPQMRPGVEVLVYADNLEATYCEKLQTLADAADAGRQPMPVDEIPELPSYPFVRYIEATP
jgi:hypothetical protein